MKFKLRPKVEKDLIGEEADRIADRICDGHQKTALLPFFSSECQYRHGDKLLAFS